MKEVSQSSFDISLTKSNIQQNKSILVLQEQIRNQMMQLEKIQKKLKSLVDIKISRSMSFSVQFTQKSQCTKNNREALNNNYSIFSEDDKQQSLQILANIEEQIDLQEKTALTISGQNNIDRQKIKQHSSLEKELQQKNLQNFNQEEQRLSKYFNLGKKFIIFSKLQVQWYRQKWFIISNVILLIIFLTFYVHLIFSVTAPKVQQKFVQQECYFFKSKDNPIVEEWFPQIKEYKNNKNVSINYKQIDEDLKRHNYKMLSQKLQYELKWGNYILQEQPIPQNFEQSQYGKFLYQQKICQYLAQKINQIIFRASQYEACTLNNQQVQKRLRVAQIELNQYPKKCYQLIPDNKKLQQALYWLGQRQKNKNCQSLDFKRSKKIKKYFQKTKQLINKSKKSQIQSQISYFDLVFEIALVNIKFLSKIQEAKQNFQQLKNINPKDSQKLSYLEECIKIRQFVSQQYPNYNEFRKYVKNLPTKLYTICKIFKFKPEAFLLNQKQKQKLQLFIFIANQLNLDRNWQTYIAPNENYFRHIKIDPNVKVIYPALSYCGQYQTNKYKCYFLPLPKYYQGTKCMQKLSKM